MNSNDITNSIKKKEVAENIIFIFLFIGYIRILPDNLFYIYNLEQFNRFKNTYLIGTIRENKIFMTEAYEKSLGILDYAESNITQ